MMFMGRIVRDPNDIRIFGRAIGMEYVDGRDDASAADMKARSWKQKWPHYVRVHHAEFIDGTLANGVSLNELMNTLKADSFAATQRNKARGIGNTDPRRAYRQQPAVQLSAQGMAWMTDQLERAFCRHGKQPASVMKSLDWPTVPRAKSKESTTRNL